METPCLTIVCHAQASRVGERAPLSSLPSGATVLLSRLEPAFAHPDGGAAEPLGDRHLSRKPIRIAMSAALDGGVTIAPDPEGTDLRLDGEVLEHVVDVPRSILGRGAVLELGTRAAILVHLLDLEAPAQAAPTTRRRDDVARLLVRFLREELAQSGEAELLEQGWLSTPLVARLVRFAWPRGEAQLREAAAKIAGESRGAGAMRASPDVERLIRDTLPPIAPGTR